MEYGVLVIVVIVIVVSDGVVVVVIGVFVTVVVIDGVIIGVIGVFVIVFDVLDGVLVIDLHNIQLRYPDVVVHRMLRAALASTPDTDEAFGTVTDLTVTAERCNIMKASAKKVSEASSEIFFGLYVKQCGPIDETGEFAFVWLEDDGD